MNKTNIVTIAVPPSMGRDITNCDLNGSYSDDTFFGR